MTSLWALLDDIAGLMDDVAVLSKVAAKKTAGVVGDDIAVSGEQLAGVKADRELPIVFAVGKGSLLNKAILVPLAIVMKAFAPFLIGPVLLCGGTYLCFEGIEKLLHAPWPWRRAHDGSAHAEAPAQPPVSEREKIRGAIRTDFILSAEIIIIALGSTEGASLLGTVIALIAVAILMTVGVYGLVALLVRFDDMGLALARGRNAFGTHIGNGMLWLAPKIMRTLSVVGTVAMFLVGGSLLLHYLHPAHARVASLTGEAFLASTLGGGAAALVCGLLLGSVAMAIVSAALGLKRRFAA
ncbi:DUF808 domain-containing protein [Solimonas marina]|nr:DUF808 domain-containing protein [Solimonas marina]